MGWPAGSAEDVTTLRFVGPRKGVGKIAGPRGRPGTQKCVRHVNAALQ